MGKLVSYHLSENSYHLKKNSPVIWHKAPFLLPEGKLVSYRLRERVSPVIQGKSCPLSCKGKLLSCPLKDGCPPALELHSLSLVLMCHIHKSWDLLSLLVLKFLCSYHNLRVTQAHWQGNDSITSNSIIPFNCLESTLVHFIKGKQVSLLLPKILGNTRKGGCDSTESEKNKSYMFLLKFYKIWTIRKACCFGLF